MPPAVHRILVANVTLAGRSGTEIVTRDLALGLRAAGHRPMVYSPRLGAIASEIAAAGVPVVSRLGDLPDPPDLVHGNQHVELVAALLQFRRARGVFVCHDRTTYWSAPPRMGRLVRYVAVDRYCLGRLTADYGIPVELTRVIHNAVDLARFSRRPPLPPAPRRAAVFSTYDGPDTHVERVRGACARLNLPLDVIGAGAGRGRAAPELDLGSYDLVFAKARCALEAMAIGAAVVLCDAQGLGPMVTSAEVARLREWNFGRSLLRQALDPDALVREARRYDPADAARVTDYIRSHAGLDASIREYVRLYDEILAAPPPGEAAFEAELDEYLRFSALRLQRLAEEVDALRSPYRMEPLPDAACARVQLRVTAAPRSVAAAARFAVDVEVRNGSDRHLSSTAPFPVHLACRWLDAQSGAAVTGEGARAILRPILKPGAVETCALAAAAPEIPGRYALRVTLVQEHVLWFDWLQPPVQAEVPLTVT